MLRLFGVSPGSPSGGYLPSGTLLSYWKHPTASATVVAVFAAAGGALLVIAARPVLTAGVMIALALVPGAALVGIGLADADLALADRGALRWAHDAVIVSVVGAAVFGLYRVRRGRGLGGPQAT